MDCKSSNVGYWFRPGEVTAVTSAAETAEESVAPAAASRVRKTTGFTEIPLAFDVNTKGESEVAFY